MRLRVPLVGLVAFAIVGSTAQPAQAQFWKKAKEAAEDAAEREVIRNVEAFVRDAVKCTFNDLECIDRAKEDGEDVVLTDGEGNVLYNEDGQPVTDPEDVPPDTPSSNYDFEPGERVLFEIDFASGNAGDFPRDLEFIKGNMEVVEWQGRRFLRATGRESRFAIQLPESLPDRFTIEFEMMDQHGSSGIAVTLVEPPNFGWAWGHEFEKAYFNAGHRQGSGIYYGNGAEMKGPVSVKRDRRTEEQVLPVRMMVDGEHAKMFIGRERVANVPRVDLGRSDRIYFFLNPRPGGEEYVYLTDIRISAGGRDLYEALSTDGRVAVRNILFDTGKSDIRPESDPVLEQIGTMLQEHPDLKLLIEGHTDDQGEFDFNMKLSADRAAAVKTYLVEKFEIVPDRLRTLGLGPTQPVDTNDSAEGQQQNRRVELVRLGDS